MFALQNLGNITNLCLEIKEYGMPILHEHSRYISKYYGSWAETCHEVATQLHNLRNIAFTVKVPRATRVDGCQLHLKAEWVFPLLQFQYSQSLQNASITLLIGGFPPGQTFDTATAFSEILRRKILRWSDRDALEAIEDFSQLPPMPAPYRFMTSHKDWMVFARANFVSFTKETPHLLSERRKS